MLGFYAISEAPISDLGDKSVYAAAQVVAYADVSAFASVFYDVSGNIVCYADVVASPNAIYWGYANVNGTAEVTALAQNISSAIAYIDGNASVSVYANSIFSFTADINAEADVTANGLRIRLADASIIGTADVTALGNETYSANATVQGYAYVTGLANAVYAGYGIINANATITANGGIIGEGWTPVVPGVETWSDITPSSDVWTAVTPSSDYWLNVTIQNLDNGGDYKAFGLLTYPEINNISVDANTTILVMNGTNGENILNTSSSGMVNWGSDNDAFQSLSYIPNQSNGTITSDFLWVSYYKNNVTRTNDSIYANDQFNSDAYWISLVNVLVGNSTPPTLHNTNTNTTSSYLSSEKAFSSLSGIVYTGSKYIAVGNQRDDAYYSPSKLYAIESLDGVTWNEIYTIDGEGVYNTIAYTTNNYSLGGLFGDFYGYPTSLFVRSTNGTSFTQVSVDSFTYNITKIIWGNNQFVAALYTGDILASSDGITWSLVFTSHPYQRRFTDIIWDGSQYVAVGTLDSNLFLGTSTDLITWSFQYPTFSYYSSSPQIAYYDGQYTIVTYGSLPLTTGNLYSLTSTDLSTWSTHNIISGSNITSSIIYENGQYIAVGLGQVGLQYDNLIVTSNDGITWTRQSINEVEGDDIRLNQIIWDGSKYITIGYKYVLLDDNYFSNLSFIATSADGITWTERSISPPPTSLTNVASGNSVIVPPQGIVILTANVSGYYPDRDLYTTYNLSSAQIDTIMDAAVSPLNITDISDTADITWIKRSYVYTPYDTTGQLYPAMAQELWYAINNTNNYIVSSPTITYSNVFDTQTVSLTAWDGVNLQSPFQNLLPGLDTWTQVNPGTDTWLRQG